MSYDGNGQFDPLSPEYPAIPGEVIYAANFNAIIEDICVGLTNALARDGQGAMLADLPMGGHKVSGMANGALPADATTFGQVFTNPLFNTSGTDGFRVVGAKADFSALAAMLLPAVASIGGSPLATQAYADALAFTTALPNQSGNSGKFVTTNGSAASWTRLPIDQLLQSSGVL